MTDKFGRPINRDSKNNIKTSDVTKSYIRDNYLESEIEEDFDFKNKYKIKNLPNPINLDDALNKRYADTNFLKISNYDKNSIVRNDRNMNFNSTNFTGLNSIYVNRDPIYDTELATKKYTDNKFNDPSIVKNTDHIDFNDKNLDNVRFVNVNSYPAVNSHLTCKEYVDNNINWTVDNSSLLRLDSNEQLDIPNQDHITLISAFTSPPTIINIPISNQNLVRNNQDNVFNNYKLTNISSVSVNHEAQEDNDLVTLGYVKSLHEDNERSRRDLGLQFYDENNHLVKNNITNDFNDNKILNVKSIEINNEPINDTDVVNKLYVDNKTDNFTQTFDSSINEHVLTAKGHIDMNDFNIENVRFMCIKYEPQADCHPVILSYLNKHVDESTILRLNDDSNERYLQARVGNTPHNLQIYNKAQIIDTTVIQNGNTGGYVLQNWLIECHDKNDSGKISNFVKTTRSSSPTGDSGATILPP